MSKTISIDLTEEQLQKIREAGLLPSEKKGQWKPDMHALYWSVLGDGITSYHYGDNGFDSYLRDSGYMFKTEEEAEAHLAKLRALARINRYCWDNWYFEPDWSDKNQKKTDIYYDHSTREFNTGTDGHTQDASIIPTLPFDAAAEDVIANCKDDLLTVFGVK